jgi:hypothetical protein
LMIVASLEKSPVHLLTLTREGVPEDKLFPLRREPLPVVRRARVAGERTRSSNGKHR